MANPQILTIKIPHLLRDTGNMNLQKIELPQAYKVDLKYKSPQKMEKSLQQL